MRLSLVLWHAVAGALLVAAAPAQSDSGIPHLAKQGTATQLIVDGRPFLMIGGELHNSSSSSLDYMRPIWSRLTALHINTVLAPVSWELIEPEEGHFDFSLVDGLIHDARRFDMRLVFLWFGTWKNGVSTYVPVWVKANSQRFPRAKDKDGKSLEIVSTFSDGCRDADSRAFSALMRHIREVDGQAHTVIAMQVENEVGVLGDSRDRTAPANTAFTAAVPVSLMDYLRQHRDTLLPELRKQWHDAGAKTSGSWEQVFGAGPPGDEVFMAWQYARYVGHVAAAGKAEYPIPMYVNTWLAQVWTPEPGKFPSGGPQARLMDVWRAGAPAIDMFEPDIYDPDFTGWCERYHRSGNPLFIPETQYYGPGPANAFYAFGQDDAMGFSPFAIDEVKDADSPIGKSYAVLSQLAPLILAHQGRNEMLGVVLDKKNKTQTLSLGGYNVQFNPPQWEADKRPEANPALVIALGPDEFLVVGQGVTVSFAPSQGGGQIGLASVDEGSYTDGHWVPERRLNGDEIESGKGVRLPPDGIAITRVKLYRY